MIERLRAANALQVRTLAAWEQVDVGGLFGWAKAAKAASATECQLTV